MTCLGGPCGHVGATVQLLISAEWNGRRGAGVAEGLGVRWLLTRESVMGDLEGWRVHRRKGALLLLERTGGTDRVGLGCVEERWTGGEDELRERLFTRLRQGSYPYDPQRLILLERQESGSEQQPVLAEHCQAEEAHVVEFTERPGRFVAQVINDAPVAVVFRTSFLRTFRVTDGEASLKIYRVAPGFPAVTLPPGVHHLEARASLPAFYLWGLGVVLALLSALTIALCHGRLPFFSGVGEDDRP